MMQFAPFPGRLRAMFRLQPLTRSVRTCKPVLSINTCNGPWGTDASWITGKRHRATADRGVVGR